MEKRKLSRVINKPRLLQELGQSRLDCSSMVKVSLPPVPSPSPPMKHGQAHSLQLAQTNWCCNRYD